MKKAAYMGTLAAFAVAMAMSSVLPVAAQTRAGCVAYGEENTDYTWRLCPGGEKYEKRYLYFGAWTEFYKIKADAGACDWAADRSSWVCSDKTIRCNPTSCGAR